MKEQLKQQLLSKLDDMDLTNISSVCVNVPVPNEMGEPIINFTPTAFLKMRQLIMASNKEVGWHGLVRREDNVFTVYDVVVYPQEVTAVTVETDDEEYVRWCISQPDMNIIRFQGHSHVDMATTPSGTDRTYYDKLLTQVPDFYIFFIMNKKMAYHLELHDVTNGISYTDLKFNIVLDDDNNLDSWYNEQAKLISEHKPKVVQTSKKKKQRGQITLDDDLRDIDETLEYEGISPADADYNYWRDYMIDQRRRYGGYDEF